MVISLMPGENFSLQQKCLFHDDSYCYLNEAFPTRCSLCFNFTSAYPVAKSKSSLVTLFDYLKSERKIDEIFPVTDEKQTTL